VPSPLRTSALLLLTLPSACRDSADAREQDADAARDTRAPAVSADSSNGTSAQRSIRATLWADSGLDASRISVDTIAPMRTIRLTGSVSSSFEKTRAGSIASAHAVGYRILNLLLIRR
jgi:osmotically-inducible protein OsmY